MTNFISEVFYIRLAFFKSLFKEYFFIKILFSVSLCLFLFFLLSKSTRNNKKKIYFVGPRSTGKTTAINLMLKKKVERTVPTRESYKAEINNCEIVELTQNNSDEEIKRFNINKRNKYIFFVKEKDETYPNLEGFDVTFVIWKKVSEKKRKDLIYLEEDYKKVLELIYRV